MKNMFKRKRYEEKALRKLNEITVHIEPSLNDKVQVIDKFISYCAKNNMDANYVGSYLAYKKKLEQEEYMKIKK